VNKNFIISTIIILLITPATLSIIADNAKSLQNSQSITNYYGKGYRYNIQGWVYIHIEGEPYERGYQYGYLGYAEILDAIQRWANFGHGIKFMKIFVIKNLPNNYEKLSEQWWNICRSRSKNIFLKQIPKEYIQEMQGITDGIKSRGEKIFGRDIEFEDILASQFVQEVWYSIKFIQKRFHPLRGFFSGIKDILSGALDNEHPGHCSAFIATGDATSNGEIVVAHSTIFNKLLAQRCNFIVDVQPSEGYRFVMTCPPGSISSQEDYYQNEMGIVITETELPQGPFNLRGSVPKGIRSRQAIQHSDSIDQVIEHLMDGNNGLIPNEWLIGDIKTGEIASFEQALYNTPIRRTFNGFFYSCNVPHDKKVKRELFGVIDYLKIIVNKIFNIYDGGRSEKFIELKEKYYGEINTEIAKQILSTDPICTSTTDGKISDSELIKNMGMLAFMGPPNGQHFVPTNEQKERFKGITDLPASGWVELYPSISEPNKLQNSKEYDNMKKTAVVIWKQKIEEAELMDSYSNVISEDTVYTSILPGEIHALDVTKGKTIWKFKTDGEITASPRADDTNVYLGSWDGNVYALDISTGHLKWTFKTGWGVDTTPIVSGNLVYFGSNDNNFYALNKDSGELAWFYNCKSAIHSSPVVYGKYVFFGSDDGRFYALDKTNGELAWSFTPGYFIKDDANNYITTPILSDPIAENGIVYIGVNGIVYALDAQTVEEPLGTLEKPLIPDNSLSILFVSLVIIMVIALLVRLYNKKKRNI